MDVVKTNSPVLSPWAPKAAPRTTVLSERNNAAVDFERERGDTASNCVKPPRVLIVGPVIRTLKIN